jgi:hypothetical protein
MVTAMDRLGIARNYRRHQAQDALTFERDRQAALEEQIAEIVSEATAGEIDEAAFSALSEGDVEIVREALGLNSDWAAQLSEEDAVQFGFINLEDDRADDGEGSTEEELARLQEEIADSQERQRALTRYLEALDASP